MVSSDPLNDDRRAFKRVRMPMYMRDVRRRDVRSPIIDISVGGLRVYSDEELPIGTRFSIEVLLDESQSLNGVVEVAWIEPLPPDAKANFDVGLRLVAAEPDQIKHLKELIDAAEPND